MSGFCSINHSEYCWGGQVLHAAVWSGEQQAVQWQDRFPINVTQTICCSTSRAVLVGRARDD